MGLHLLQTCAWILLISVGVREATKCFQFTWPGVVDWDDPTDNETTCDDKPDPCIQPFVLSMNSTPPNITKLNKLCDEGGCPGELWCNTKSGESCVRWVYWTHDVITNDLKMLNYSLFCGRAHSGDNATKVYDTAVTDGCYKQDLGATILETCFCYDSPECNAPPYP